MTSRVYILWKKSFAWMVIPHEKLVDRLMQSSKDAVCFSIIKAGGLALPRTEVRWIYVHNRTL